MIIGSHMNIVVNVMLKGQMLRAHNLLNGR